MKKLQFGRNSGSGMLKSKVFYVALGLCIVAVGVAVYIGVNGTLNNLSKDGTENLKNTSSQETSSSDWAYPNTAEVNKNQSDLPESSPSQPSSVTPQAPKQEAPANTVQEQTPVVAPQFAMPLSGDVINSFSNGELVKSKTLKEWRTHDGVDLKAAANTPVKCAADGKVEEIIEDPMWGVCVTITHNDGYVSYYKGLKPSVDVKVGQELKVADVIGYVGNTAEIEIGEDSHLHFAMKKADVWIDPLSVMPSQG